MFKKIMRADYEFHKDYWGNVSVEARDLISRLLVGRERSFFMALFVVCMDCFSVSYNIVSLLYK